MAVMMSWSMVNCLGQDALRASAAGEQSAEFQKATEAPGYYNLQVGPVLLNFKARMGIEFNDNPSYSQYQRVADVGFRPGADIGLQWQVNDQSRLFFSTGVDYVEYLRNSYLNHLSVSPDSGLVYHFYVGDFAWELHDRLTVQDTVAQNAALGGSLFIQLNNTAGTGVTWDLNKLVFTLKYDHVNSTSLTTNYTYADNSAELLNLRSAFLLNPTDKAGVEFGGGSTTYDQDVLQNNTHLSAGLFYEAQLSPYVSVKISGGYLHYWFDPSSAANSLAVLGTTNELGSLSSYYANLSLTHRLNSRITQTLTAGRQTQAGVSSSISAIDFVRYSANWNVAEKLLFSPRVSYERGTTSGGLSENYDRYGGGFGLGYPLTRKISTTATYDFFLKNSNVPGFNYYNNTLVLSMVYSF